jgi:hypothetical protein
MYIYIYMSHKKFDAWTSTIFIHAKKKKREREEAPEFFEMRSNFWRLSRILPRGFGSLFWE